MYPAFRVRKHAHSNFGIQSVWMKGGVCEYRVGADRRWESKEHVTKLILPKSKFIIMPEVYKQIMTLFCPQKAHCVGENSYQ